LCFLVCLICRPDWALSRYSVAACYSPLTACWPSWATFIFDCSLKPRTAIWNRPPIGSQWPEDGIVVFWIRRMFWMRSPKWHWSFWLNSQPWNW
jgi:hypothetical protein